MDITERKITKIAREAEKLVLLSLREEGVGTAEIDPRTCLAYRMTGCRDCYDACNYSAIELKDEGGANPIPYVVEDKCNGCGACQAACLSLSSGSIKSTERAIVVRPIEA